MKGKLWTAIGLGGLVLGGLSGQAGAAPADTPPPEECFIVADGTADLHDGKGPDQLISVRRSDTNAETNETNIGDGTGTFNVEAIALQPGTGVLFAADAGTLGTIDLTTGKFSAIGPIGAGTGSVGEVTFDDVDGLSFDATTGFLYGTHRESKSDDLLLRIDPTTGAAVPGAIAGADYAVVPPVADLHDIDSIAVDPLDGKMYAVANNDGRMDHLVLVDKATGAATDIGVLEAQDVEGLGFASGQMIGTTGKVFKQEGIWDIDKTSGKATNRRPLDNAADYESFDCLNPPNPLTPDTPVVPPAPPSPVACLVVMEDAVPNDAVDFPFTTNGPGLPPGFVLDDDGDGALANTVTYCPLAPGPYTVRQQTPVAWPLTDVTCTDPTGGTMVSLPGGQAVADLAAGETVTCVFQNTRKPEVLGDVVERPQAAPPVAVTPPPAAPAQAEAQAAELPRTGDAPGRLLLLAGLGLALGGLAVMGGARRARTGSVGPA